MRGLVAVVLVGCYSPTPVANAPCGPAGQCPTGLQCDMSLTPPLCTRDGAGPDATEMPDMSVVDTLTWQQYATGSYDDMLLASVTTSTPLEAMANDLFIAVVSTKPSAAVTSVTGLGLSWTKIREQCGGRDTARLSMFWAKGQSPTPGMVTAQLSNGTPMMGSALLSVHRYSGAHPVKFIGNVSSMNSNGIDAAATCANGTDTSTYSWSTLDTMGAGSIVFAAVHTARYDLTPGAGYTERADDHSGLTTVSAGVAVEEQVIPAMTTDVTVSGEFPSSPDWAVIAVELRD